MAVNEEQNKKDIRLKENKQQTDRYKSNDINNYITVNKVNFPVKDKNCESGYRSKTQLYVVYKRHTLDLKTQPE